MKKKLNLKKKPTPQPEVTVETEGDNSTIKMKDFASDIPPEIERGDPDVNRMHFNTGARSMRMYDQSPDGSIEFPTSREKYFAMRDRYIKDIIGEFGDEGNDSVVDYLMKVKHIKSLFNKIFEINNDVLLDDLDTYLDDFRLRIAKMAHRGLLDYKELQNFLLKFYHQLQGIMSEVDQLMDPHKSNVNNNHRNYDINNEIKLLNFCDSRVPTILDMFSDPDFVTHIIRKDTFKNKYVVVVYDAKWDPKFNSEEAVGTNHKVFGPEAVKRYELDDEARNEYEANDYEELRNRLHRERVQKNSEFRRERRRREDAAEVEEKKETEEVEENKEREEVEEKEIPRKLKLSRRPKE